MRYSLHDHAKVTVQVPPQPAPQVSANVDLPQEYVPPGVEDTLKKLGWWPEYDAATDSSLFKRLHEDGPYARGYYHWYEVVALEALNLITLGTARDEANKRAAGSVGGVAAATGMR